MVTPLLPIVRLTSFLKRESLVSALTTVLDSDSAASQSAVRQSMLNRHREILQEHRRERQRLRNLIADNRARSSLLKNVRTDISNFRGANPAEQEENYMLDERGHIDSSHDMMDGLLSRAYAVNESLGFQRESLANINRKIIGAASQVPGLNTLIARIGSRKRRDSIIMGSLIALCVLLVLYFR